MFQGYVLSVATVSEGITIPMHPGARKFFAKRDGEK